MKKKDVLYIDAYNVIYALPELQQDREADLETARKKLVEWLANYGAHSGQEIVVVFDAHLTENAAMQEDPYPGVKVIFTAVKETADHYIERDTRRAVVEGATVRVVTGDYAEQLLILGGGALRMSVKELREDMRHIIQEADEKYGENITNKRNELAGRLRGEIASQLEQMRRQP